MRYGSCEQRVLSFFFLNTQKKKIYKFIKILLYFFTKFKKEIHKNFLFFINIFHRNLLDGFA